MAGADWELLERGLSVLCEDNPALAEPRTIELLKKYIEQIELYNATLGLVGVENRDELVIKHILDSLAPLQAVRRELDMAVPRLSDVGTGAGLPGLPLAIALPSISMTLIERMGRRVGFLETTVAALRLTNVDIEQTDAERALPGRFDLITFRAFRPLEPDMLKALFRLLAPGGQLAAWKARPEKIAEEMGAIEHLVGEWESIETPVPFLDEPRNLVLVRPPVRNS